MKRLLLILLLCATSHAQQTVIQRVLNTVTSPTASSPVQNVGQGSHQVSIYASNSSGTCSGTGSLQYSYDNITWANFSSAQATTQWTFINGFIGPQIYLVNGNGVYPLVRFNLSALSGATCTVTAWYSGSPGGPPVQTVGQASVFQLLTSGIGGPNVTQMIPTLGQSSHQVSFQVTNVSGTCSGNAQLEYSFDTVNWVVFTAAQAIVSFAVGTPGVQSYLVSGNGFYPYLRFNVPAFSGGSCTWAAYYSGAAPASGPVTTVGQATVQTKILSAVSGPGASQAVSNVGQGSHQVTLFITNVSGTCSGSGQLEYSFDNSTWTVFNAVQAATAFSVSAAGTQAFNVSGNSVFPFVRFNLTAFAGGSCTATAWYSGAPGGSEPIKTIGSGAVFVQPFVNYQGGSLTVNLPNSGQTFHQIWAQLTNVGGQTCATTDSWTLNLFGNAVTTGPVNQVINLQVFGSGTTEEGGPIPGSGHFQNLTLQAFPNGSATAHCVLNAWYSGSNVGPLPAVSAHFPNGGSAAQSFPVPITQCGNSANISVSSGSTSVIVAAGPAVSSLTIRVCQIVVTSPTAAAVATISSSNTGSSCAAPLTLGSFNMAVGVPITLGSALGNILTLPYGKDLCLQATTGNVNGYASYDFQ